MEILETTRRATARPAVSYRRVLPRDGDDALAKGLGAFSIALGLAELLAPRALSSLIGIRPRPVLLRLFGLREVASGIAILAQRRPASALWSRVAGDAIDLGSLGAALLAPGTDKGRALFAAANVGAVTALDVLGAVRWTRKTRRVVKTLAVNKTAHECYAFWRELENLPAFMEGLGTVTEDEIVKDEPDSLIAWRSGPGARTESRGVVEFYTRPGGRGAMVHVALYTSKPEGQLKAALRRFKQLIETGEIPTTEGQSKGGDA